MLRGEELRNLSKPSGWHSSASIALDWALIAGAFALPMLVPHPLAFVASFLLLSRQQLALAIVMHDGAHRRLFVSHKVNDWICQLTCAAPLFFSMYSYQKLHLKHHREPLAADDPDLSLIGGYPISKGSFLRKIARDASGVSYFKFIRYFIHMARKPRTEKALKPEKDLGPAELKGQGAGKGLSLPVIVATMLAVNFAMWLALFLLGHGWLYLFLWVLPAVTALQVLLRIRGIAEHAGYQPGPDQSRNARTVLPSFQTIVFAPHNVNFHIEHHLYPSVPFFRLPELHRILRERGAIPATNVYPGYGKVLAELVR